MASPPLVDQVHDLSEGLRTLANLLPNEHPLRPDPGKKNAPSFLFEIFVLLAMLRGLKRLGWEIVAQLRDGKVRLVRGPAAKASGSYFRIARESTVLQVTQGTRIKDRLDRDRAPDLCLQRGDADDKPTFRDVLAIWETKLRGTTGEVTTKRISDSEFRSFAMIRDWLAPPAPGEDPLSEWPAAFRVCAIVSNGRRPTEPRPVLIDARVSIVENFSDENTAIWPSRQEHIAARESLSHDSFAVSDQS